MLTPVTTASYARELAKLAYGGMEHSYLASLGADAAGIRSPVVREMILTGALNADHGVRDPYLPFNDKIHSFPGSQTREQALQNAADSRIRGGKDVARALQGEGLWNRITRGARLASGLADIGEGSHQMADVSAHYDKPVEMGIAALKERAEMPLTGYGGGLITNVEHRATERPDAKYHLDEFKPKVFRTDREAVKNQIKFGKELRAELETLLTRDYGLSVADARRALDRDLVDMAPGRVARLVGEATRSLKHVGRESKRLASTVLSRPKELASLRKYTYMLRPG